MTARDHSKLIGVFFLIVGGLHALLGLFVLVGYGLLGAVIMSAGKSDSMLAGGLFVVAAIIIGAFILLIAGLHLLSGWRLFKGLQTAKLPATISSVLVLLNIPFGTALGIYSLWFLYGDKGKEFFSGNNFANYAPPAAVPPGPQSWQ